MTAIIELEKCEGCGDCVDECPTEAISMVNEKAVVEEEACSDCGACVDVCPTDAISME